MYQSPIEIFTRIVAQKINENVDGMILNAVIDAGIHVDRDELIKALAYDRNQYEKGYADGKAEAAEWISVEERLPEDGENVLAIDSEGKTEVCFYETEHKGVFQMCGGLCKIFNITHWMPLPEPPKEEA